MANDINTFSLLRSSVYTEGQKMDSICIANGGTKLYSYSDTYNLVCEATLPTPYDTSVINHVNYKNISDSLGTDARIDASGTRLFVVGEQYLRITQWGLSTAWQISSGNITNQYNWADTKASRGFAVSPDGTKVYTLGSSAGYIREYTFPIAWDFTTTPTIVDFVIPSASHTSFHVSHDGKTMFVAKQFPDLVTQYNMGTAWDLSTATDPSISHNFGMNVYGIDTSPDGTLLFLTNGTTDDSIYTYQSATPVRATGNITITGFADINERQKKAVGSISMSGSATGFQNIGTKRIFRFLNTVSQKVVNKKFRFVNKVEQDQNSVQIIREN